MNEVWAKLSSVGSLTGDSLLVNCRSLPRCLFDLHVLVPSLKEPFWMGLNLTSGQGGFSTARSMAPCAVCGPIWGSLYSQLPKKRCLLFPENPCPRPVQVNMMVLEDYHPREAALCPLS